VPSFARGVEADSVRIAVLKTGAVFGDVEAGVEARIGRVNRAGGLHGREVELARVLDDEGDPETARALAEELVEAGDVFAVVLASAVPGPEVTDVFEQNAMPFFGWGFAPGFCAPNTWGFGFNGCLIGTLLGLPDAAPDTAEQRLISDAFGDDATVAIAVDDDTAGEAAAALADQVWGERLVATVPVDAAGDIDAAVDALVVSGADVLLLSVRLDSALTLRTALGDSFDGPVVDNVAYLPGLLGDFAVAEVLEGGYSITQFPPQEEYRDVTATIADDLAAVDAPLVYSQAVSLGYWSADLLTAILDAVGPDLDTATFLEAAVTTGVDYTPGPAGAPCPITTADIHTQASGGAAIVRVVGGIYQPVAAFTCS
jgi:branched-chain amino acid transport system substrate-binding protein